MAMHTLRSKRSRLTGEEPQAWQSLAVGDVIERLSTPLHAQALFETVDWAKTELGAPELWPAEIHSLLRTSVFPCNQPVALLLGPRLRMAYNTAYNPILGPRHPTAMGCPVLEVFPELSTLFRGVTHEGRPFFSEQCFFVVERNGYPEESYFEINYLPIQLDNRAIVGVYALVPEITNRVVSQRRLSLLRELSLQSALCLNASEALTAGVKALATNEMDFPFVALYVVDQGGKYGTLQHSFGGLNDKLTPSRVSLDEATAPDDPWKIFTAFASRAKQTLPMPPGCCRAIQGREPTVVHILPFDIGAAQQQQKPSNNIFGILVVGRNPFVAPNDSKYESFLALVVNSLAANAAVSNTIMEERRRAEEQRQLSEAKSAFFSNVSHEFRTPLTLLLGPLEDMLRDSTMGEAARVHRLEIVFDNASRLLRLVNNLLEFSSIDARMQSMHCVAVANFTAYTLALVNSFRYKIESAGIRLLTDACEQIELPVTVDRDMWEKIVFNIMGNATKYTQAGEISVVLRRIDENVEYSVIDSGIGIAPEHIPRLFERFYRVENPSAPSVEGTGIGLALIQELIRAHGGSISVTSTLGVGSKFSVLLPLRSNVVGAPQQLEVCTLEPAQVRPRTSSPLPPVPVTSSSSQGVILLVEDNEQMRDYIRTLLESCNYCVTEAKNGKEALQVLRNHRPDLVISDVMMPLMNGLELLAAVREDALLCDLPVLLLSARGGEESRLSGLEGGCDDYLTKPFTSREVLCRVRLTLELTRLRRSVVLERDANAMKNRFFAMLSHELRTPLTPLLLLSEALASDALASESVRRDAQLIRLNVQLEAALIDDLLDCSKLLSDRIVLKLEDSMYPSIFLTNSLAPLLPILQQSVAMAASAITEKRLRVVFDGDTSGDVTVKVDRTRLHQVLWNLVKNACSFSPAGGCIQIIIRRIARSSSGERVTLCITDEGPGIEHQLLPDKLFELGVQGNERRGSLGVGLFLCQSLIAQHGGILSARNRSDGQSGAEFLFSLPAAVPSSAQLPHIAQQQQFSPATATHLRILVVEDNETTKMILRRLLEKNLQCAVSIAGSVSDAKKLAQNHEYDLVVSDIGLPDGDGWQLLQALQQHRPALRGIAMSGFGMVADIQRSREAGFSAHLTKPIRFEALCTAIQAVVSGVEYFSPLSHSAAN